MIINKKPEVVSGLKGNQALVDRLGGPRIYHLKAPDSAAFPRITYMEYDNYDSDYADDFGIASRIHIQISIWSKNAADLSPVGSLVDDTMVDLGFIRSFATELYEDDAKVYHKVMRYSGKFLTGRE